MENVVWRGKPVAWAFADGFAGGAILIAVSLLLPATGFAIASYIAAVGVACGILMILFAVVRACANTYIVAEDSVRREYRLVAVRVEEAKYDMITNIVVEQGILGRLLGFGDVKCDTAGTAFLGVLFRGVRKPLQVKEIIEGAMEKKRQASPRLQIPPAAKPPSSRTLAQAP